MWDLKLFFFDIIYSGFISFIDIILQILNTLSPVLNNGFQTLHLKNNYQFPQNMTFYFSFKFLLCIFFLILIRGGTPRYRYDYLTKLGWLKFISIILTNFILLVMLLFSY